MRFLRRTKSAQSVVRQILLGRLRALLSGDRIDLGFFTSYGRQANTNSIEEANYMARVIVTGGSGKVGRACVEELLQHGYEVFNVDTTRPAKERARFTQVDLTDFGQAIDAMSGIDELYRSVDGVVHLAA